MEERYFVCVECGVRCDDPIGENYWEYQWRGLCNCCGADKSKGHPPFKYKPQYVGYQFGSGIPYPLLCEIKYEV